MDFCRRRYDREILKLSDLIIGLPCGNSLVCDVPNILTDYRVFGHSIAEKSIHHDGMSFSDSDYPVEKDFYFLTKDCTLTNIKEELKYPQDLIPRKKYQIVFSGRSYKYQNGQYDFKIYYDPQRMSLVNKDYSLCFSLESVSVVVPITKLDSHIFSVKIVPLLETEGYKFMRNDHYDLQIFMTNYPLPDESLLTAGYRLFKENTFDHIEIRCSDGSVFFPKYLSVFCGPNGSPIFYEGDYKSGEHLISMRSLRLILGWILDILMLRKIPTFEQFEENEFNLDEWIFVSDYFNFPYLQKLFQDFKRISNPQ